MKVDRRDFLKLSAGSVGALLLAEPTVEAGWLPNPLARVPTPWHEGDVTSVLSICENCFWKCGIRAYVEGGKVRKVEGYEGNPKSRGMLCPRGQGAVLQTYDPDRLKQPLIRVEGSERGEGRYREASWDEALDRIATGMLAIKERHGSESMAFFAHGTGDSWFAEYLPAAWGTPNVAKPSVSLCTAPRETASQWTFGRPVGGHEPIDWVDTRYIVLLGHHIGEDTHNTQLQDFSIARRNGARLVVVDPRFSTAAAKADRWLPIRPGTDTALLLAWLNVLVEEELYDRDYVERYTVGFAALARHVKDLTLLSGPHPSPTSPPTPSGRWPGSWPPTRRRRCFRPGATPSGTAPTPSGCGPSTWSTPCSATTAAPAASTWPNRPTSNPTPIRPFPLEPAAGGCGGATARSEVEAESDFRPAADHGKLLRPHHRHPGTHRRR